MVAGQETGYCGLPRPPHRQLLRRKYKASEAVQSRSHSQNDNEARQWDIKNNGTEISGMKISDEVFDEE